MSSAPQDPSSYDAVVEQHRRLRELLSQIQTALDQRQIGMAEVGDLLARLGDQLIRHFALEESGGYLCEALLHAPQLVRRANDLLAQHPKMARQARSLAAEPVAAAGGDWWGETHQRFTAFAHELREHERREDRLLQEAYTHETHASD